MRGLFPRYLYVLILALFFGEFAFAAAQEDRSQCILQIKNSGFGQYSQAQQACQQCLGNTPAAAQCPIIANAWCYSSDKCSQRGSGCEAVAGCQEAMRAKEAKDANDNQKTKDEQPAKVCEGTLKKGARKEANKKNCYCPVDQGEYFATNSDKQCDQIAKWVEENKTQQGDSQEDQLSLRQCEIRKEQAEACCADPQKCLSRVDMNPVMPAPSEGISNACKDMRKSASENATSNVNAGGACTQAYANCQAECESSAKKYPDSDQGPKIRQVAQSCKSLSEKAKRLGEQGVETLVSGYFGQNCAGMSQSADQREDETKIPPSRATPGGEAPAVAREQSGAGRYVDSSQGPTILQRNIAGPSGDDPYAREEITAAIMFTPVGDTPRTGPSLNALALGIPAAIPTGGMASSPHAGSTREGAPLAAAGRAGFSQASAASGPAVSNYSYVPTNRAAAVGRGSLPASVAATAVGLAPSAITGKPSAPSPAGGHAPLPLTQKPVSGNTVKEQNPVGKAGNTSGSGIAAMSASRGISSTARDVAGGTSLKDYLPGGSRDPHTGIGGAARPSSEIHAKHVNLFEVINDVMSEKCQLGELYDCG